MEAAMEKRSRQSVVLKVGAVFAAGLLLFIGQFGSGCLWDMLFIFTLPFVMWNAFVSDGVFVVWYGLAVLMLAFIGVCIWSRRLLWIAYILIGAYWFWTYVLLALSF